MHLLHRFHKRARAMPLSGHPTRNACCTGRALVAADLTAANWQAGSYSTTLFPEFLALCSLLVPTSEPDHASDGFPRMNRIIENIVSGVFNMMKRPILSALMMSIMASVVISVARYPPRQK
jgi:hypothetical protein